MATVVIVDYDPSWPDQFEQLAAALRPRLGDAAVAIDPIGSTSVPGLAAKDIIDIQVTVASLADADRLGPAFQQAGYAATRYRSDHRPAGDSSDPALWEKRLWQSRPGARRGSTSTSASPAGRTSGTRCCSGTTCGHIRKRPPPMRGSSVRWPNDSVTTWSPIPTSRITPVT
jgi:GrpB-like predicted nucleotidyltransferase (UPF0157 family)